MRQRYFLRQAPKRADIRVNLIHKAERAYASHSLALRMRDDLTAIAQGDGVKLKIVELPAGPPTMPTVVAAVCGGTTESYEDLINIAPVVKARLRREPGVVDVDDTVEEDQAKYIFEVDKQKAAGCARPWPIWKARLAACRRFATPSPKANGCCTTSG